jgi:hypothetical protein
LEKAFLIKKDTKKVEMLSRYLLKA